MSITSRVTRNPATLLAKVHIMVIDNDASIVELMREVLTTLGFPNVYGALDGFQAVNLMRKQKIDLIITDWELRPINERTLGSLGANPIMQDTDPDQLPNDGACFVRFLRGAKSSPNPDLPVIMMTSDILKNHAEYARDAGVDEVLPKPVSAEDLCRRIAAVIERPQPFVTSQQYKGPCRRRERLSPPNNAERRVHDIKIVKFA
jgi:two-component system chemotaxis response regulator CheY